MPERKLDYREMENSAHKGYVVEAPSLERLYIDAGLALTDQLVRLDLIQEPIKRTVTVQHDTREGLMVAWLNALIACFESEKFLSKRIVFNQFDGKKITSTLYGQYYSPIQHGHVGELKAMTTAQLEMGLRPEPEHGFYAKVTIALQDR